MRMVAAVAAYALLLGVLAACTLVGQPEISPEVARRPALFTTERAMDDLREIDALTIASGGRAVGRPGNAVVSTYVGHRLEAAGLRVYEQTFQDRLGGTMRNVIGVLPGSREGSILVSAHHDANGRSPAAVEGSAGLAILLELARSASEASTRAGHEGIAPMRTMVFASWDGETFGCAGAGHFVDALSPRELQAFKAMVSLDALGWSRGQAVLHTLPYEDRMGVPSIAPDWLVTRASNAASVRGESLPVGDPWLGPVYQVLVRKVDLGYYSADRAFLARGIPAVFVSQFSLSRSYADQGSMNDTIDRISSDQVGSAGRAVEAALTDLATGESLPVGEQRYLVLLSPFGGSFRLTTEPIKLLAFLSLLPAAFLLLGLGRGSPLQWAGVLFAASGVLFVAGTILLDPALFPALFLPALLATPLLAVRRPAAVVGHVAAYIPVFLFAALIVPVYLTGSSRLVKVTPAELWLLGGMAALGLAQAALHHGRVRSVARERAAKAKGEAVLGVHGIPSAGSVPALPRGASGLS